MGTKSHPSGIRQRTVFVYLWFIFPSLSAQEIVIDKAKLEIFLVPFALRSSKNATKDSFGIRLQSPIMQQLNITANNNNSILLFYNSVILLKSPGSRRAGIISKRKRKYTLKATDK